VNLLRKPKLLPHQQFHKVIPHHQLLLQHQQFHLRLLPHHQLLLQPQVRLYHQLLLQPQVRLYHQLLLQPQVRLHHQLLLPDTSLFSFMNASIEYGAPIEDNRQKNVCHFTQTKNIET
jgi:hypothetical protein